MREIIDPSADQGAIEPTCRITSADGSESEYMFDEDADEVQVVAIVSSLWINFYYITYSFIYFKFSFNWYFIKVNKNKKQ